MSYGSGAGDPTTPAALDQCLPSCSSVYASGDVRGIAHRYIPADGGLGRLTLYGINGQDLVRIGSLHGAPNPADGGKLETVGPHGFSYLASIPFDISGSGNGYVITNDGVNSASLRSYLRRIDLDSGAASAPAAIGTVRTNLIGLTAAPGITPGTYTVGTGTGSANPAVTGGGGGGAPAFDLLILLLAAALGRRLRFRTPACR